MENNRSSIYTFGNNVVKHFRGKTSFILFFSVWPIAIHQEKVPQIIVSSKKCGLHLFCGWGKIWRKTKSFPCNGICCYLWGRCLYWFKHCLSTSNTRNDFKVVLPVKHKWSSIRVLWRTRISRMDGSKKETIWEVWF